jgi:hypothetical protein
VVLVSEGVDAWESVLPRNGLLARSTKIEGREEEEVEDAGLGVESVVEAAARVKRLLLRGPAIGLPSLLRERFILAG